MKFDISRSLKNCHVPGLHSIVLSEKNRCLTRVYIHEPGGGLSADAPLNFVSDTMPLAIHGHHRHLRLEMVAGGLVNYMFLKSHHGFPVQAWQYDSKINGGTGGFQFTHTEFLICTERRVMRVWGARDKTMKGADLHTVTCPSGEWSAWIVEEGAQDPRYFPHSYSNRELSNLTTEGLYRPFSSKEEIEQLLDKVGMI